MKYDLFISYSRKDFNEVSSILETIKTAIPKLSYWFDIDGIESGDEFEDKIISAIDNSSYVLFALSENSIQSQWTKDEVMYAKNTDKKVIPILLKGAQMKGWFLFKFGRIDCIDSTNTLQIQKLLQNLSDWTGKDCVDFSAESVVERTSEQLCPCGSGKLFKDCHGRFISLDNSTESHHAGPVETERSWKVGDYYTGANKSGIVFWVDHTGKHGKIVSLDQKNNLPFCKYSRHDVSLHDACDGEKNFQAIEKNWTWKNEFPASEWCARHGDGWYLPAIEELCDLVRVYDEVNQGLKENKGTELIIAKSYPCRWYLSSTEYDETRMRAVGMEYRSKDFLDSNLASREIYIRAIAKF